MPSLSLNRSGAVPDALRPLWLGTAVLRVLTYVFAVVVVVLNYDEYAHPHWAVIGVLVMGLWTPVALAYCLARSWRKPWIVFVDLVVTSGLLVSSLWIQSSAQTLAGSPLLTTVWASGPPVAAGVMGGWPAGAASGFVIAALTALCRQTVNTDVLRDAVLLVGAGFVVGMAATTARRSTEALARALRTEAANAERERLASSIHDSVLQVLARVRRRGHEVGGEAAELATLAGEQEIALRSLMATGPPRTSDTGEVDLRGLLRPMATSRVQISTPGTPTPVAADVASDLAAVVREMLTNVARHAGADAHAWVLLEDLDDRWVISVRDDGVGTTEERLAQAAAEGRLGVAHSIRAKARSVGGVVELDTAPGKGTEWELSVPKNRSRRCTGWGRK